jgi:hypothetical protein
MKVVFTAGLAFTGNSGMGSILFDQSRLYPAGKGPEEEPVVPTP